MKKSIIALFLCCICLCGCGVENPVSQPTVSQTQVQPAANQTQAQSTGKLNEWQVNLLETMGLPTDYDQLSATQQNTIERAWVMISYLNEKYGEEFVYVKYIPKEQFQSETLVAYPRSTGSGDGKYLVTVKTKDDGFTDDYSDFSVTDLAEKLTNDFLTEKFGNNYKYFISPLACNITKAEMKDGKFQWKYGAENSIFVLEELCPIDNIEMFTVEYAKFLYEHELSGSHRIDVLKVLPTDDSINQRSRIYGNDDGVCTGFYCISSNAHQHIPTVYYTDYHKYDKNAVKPWIQEFDIQKEYQIEEYFSKHS